MLNELSKMPAFFKKILLDLIFPINCIGCGKHKEILCKECLKAIKPLDLQSCPYCEKAITLNGEVCNICLERFRPSIDRLIVVADYKNELLSRAIHLFKYKFIKSLGEPLGTLIINNTTKLTIPTPDFIIPIPLHSKRLRWRGFNQSELLAKELSSNLLPGINITLLNDLIIRRRHTTPQMKIKKYKDRHQNLNNVFTLNNKFDWDTYNLKNKNLTNKNIFIVDDVITTGATIFKFSEELKKLQPKSISVIVLGRQH